MQAEQTVDVAAAWHELGDRLRVQVARRIEEHGDADDVAQPVMVRLLERAPKASVRGQAVT